MLFKQLQLSISALKQTELKFLFSNTAQLGDGLRQFSR